MEVKVTVTCEACPTQADLDFSDGRYGYFRYRFGRWSLSLYPSRRAGLMDYAHPDVELGEDWREDRGDLDGYLTPGELRELLERVVPAAELWTWGEML